jgi:RNA recognition motif-containing protein
LFRVIWSSLVFLKYGRVAKKGIANFIVVLPAKIQPVFCFIQKKLEKERIMSTKLYVGNLSFHLTNEDLQGHFAQAGTVESAKIIEDRDTGRSRGFGFVEMSSAEEAQAAIEQFNGEDLDGRSLVVNEARPREDRGGGGRGGYGGGNRDSGDGGGDYSRW